MNLYLLSNITKFTQNKLISNLKGNNDNDDGRVQVCYTIFDYIKVVETKNIKECSKLLQHLNDIPFIIYVFERE